MGLSSLYRLSSVGQVVIHITIKLSSLFYLLLFSVISIDVKKLVFLREK